jgi:hypothetical protein
MSTMYSLVLLSIRTSLRQYITDVTCPHETFHEMLPALMPGASRKPPHTHDASPTSALQYLCMFRMNVYGFSEGKEDLRLWLAGIRGASCHAVIGICVVCDITPALGMVEERLFSNERNMVKAVLL